MSKLELEAKFERLVGATTAHQVVLGIVLGWVNPSKPEVRKAITALKTSGREDDGSEFDVGYREALNQLLVNLQTRS